MLERALSLPLVDGRELPDELQGIFRPGEALSGEAGGGHSLPRWFIEVPGRDEAETEIAPNFRLREFLVTDVREARALHRYPRYVPCAVTILATVLSALRQHWGTYVHVAANGGYRSPAHALNRGPSPHCWGTAANIHRIGDRYLDSRRAIEEAAADVRSILPGVYVRSYGHGPGEADDHLHIDLGYVELMPHEVVEDRTRGRDGR